MDEYSQVFDIDAELNLLQASFRESQSNNSRLKRNSESEKNKGDLRENDGKKKLKHNNTRPESFSSPRTRSRTSTEARNVSGTQLEVQQAVEAFRFLDSEAFTKEISSTEDLESQFMKMRSHSHTKRSQNVLKEISNNRNESRKILKEVPLNLSSTQREVQAIKSFMNSINTQDYEELCIEELTLSEVLPNILNYSTVAIAGKSRKLGKSTLMYEIIADVLIKKPTEEIFVITFLHTFDAQKCARIIRKHCRKANVIYRSEDHLARIRIFIVENNAKFNIVMRNLDALIGSLKISLLVIENLNFYYQNWKNSPAIAARWVSRKEYINYYMQKFTNIAIKRGVTTLVTLPDHLMEQNFKEKKARKFSENASEETNSEELKNNVFNPRQSLKEDEIDAALLIILEKQKSSFIMRVKNNSYDSDEKYLYQIGESGFEWKEIPKK